VNYVSKWIEAIPCRAVDVKHARKIFNEIIFPRFGILRIVISDGGSHSIDAASKVSSRNLGACITSRVPAILGPSIKQKYPIRK